MDELAHAIEDIEAQEEKDERVARNSSQKSPYDIAVNYFKYIYSSGLTITYNCMSPSSCGASGPMKLEIELAATVEVPFSVAAVLGPDLEPSCARKGTHHPTEGQRRERIDPQRRTCPLEGPPSGRGRCQRSIPR